MSDSGLSWDDIRNFSVRDGKLYWHGNAVVTEKRFSTQERVLAWIGVALAAIGVAATCVQAWFAAFPPHP